MDKNKLNEILKSHTLWLNDVAGGQRADLQDADLQDADLQDADLRGADLQDADLQDADLQDADLRGADLQDADLQDAGLRGADLRGADLRGADLRGAGLQGADLRGAGLQGADLRGADLRDAYHDSTTSYMPLQCPETGPFIGYKKTREQVVQLWIPADAKRSSATSRKCRCDKAVVMDILNTDRSKADLTKIESAYDRSFVYKIGQTVSVDNFNDDRWAECTAGIHFFITFDEAAKY